MPNRKIYIIHSSEIVRKGLASILKSYFNVEIILLESIKEIQIMQEQKELNILIFIEYFDSFDQSKIHQLKEQNKVKTIGITYKKEENSNIYGFSNCISLKSTSSEISEISSELLKSFEPDNQTKTDSSELSTRERDVLQLVALGNTNKEIAEKLFISIHTVISHRKNITEKLGIKSISGLTVYAIINKVIDTENINPETLI